MIKSVQALCFVFVLAAGVSGQQIEFPKDFPPAAIKPAKEAMKSKSMKNLERANRDRQLRDNQTLLTLLSMMDENDNALEVLELIGDQKANITALQKEYQGKRDNLWKRTDLPRSELRNELSKLKAAYIKKISKVMVPHQTRELARADAGRVGIHKALTDSVMGDALRLTDAQKSKIRKNSMKVSEDIEKSVSKIRQQSYDAIFDVLNNKQKEKLKSAFTPRQFVMMFEQNDLFTLFQHLQYPEKKSQLRSIRRTKVKGIKYASDE